MGENKYMKNTRPIEDFSDLVYYNEKLKEQGLLQCEILNVSAVKDSIVLSNGSKKITLPLMQTLRNFVTEPEYCFINLNKLSRIDFSLLCAISFPGHFQERLKSTVNNLLLLGINEIELGGGVYDCITLDDKSINLALKGCKEKQEVLYMPSCANLIVDRAFKGKRTPRHIISYSKVLEIGEDAFLESRVLQSISTPNGIKSIGLYSFYKCRALKSIELNSDMQEIPNYAFYGCLSLTKLKLPKGLRRIWSGACRGSGIEEIDFSSCTSLEEIGASAFADCENLKSVEFKNCVELNTIANDAFSRCSSLKTFDMSETKIKSTILDYVLSDTQVEEICFPNGYQGTIRDGCITYIKDFLLHSRLLTIKNFPYSTIKKFLKRSFRPGSNIETKRYNLALFITTLYRYSTRWPKICTVNGMNLEEAEEIIKKQGQ